jgi:phosphoribosylglycinamide formyltransferase-1
LAKSKKAGEGLPLFPKGQAVRRQVPIGVLISGSGTNLQSIIDAIEAKELDAKIQVVLSNRADAYGLVRAKKHGIPVEVLDHKRFPNREAVDQAVVDILRAREVELVVLAGFMRLLSPVFVGAYSNRIMNIHPALLPAFPGLHVQKKAMEHGVRFSGCTVHFVNEECDEGPIIIQAVVPVFPEDTEESLAARILEQEHRIYPRAIQLYSEGRLRIEGRKVFVDGLARKEDQVLVLPPLQK